MFNKKQNKDGADKMYLFLEVLVKEVAKIDGAQKIFFGVPKGYEGKLRKVKEREEFEKDQNSRREELRKEAEEYAEIVGLDVKIPEIPSIDFPVCPLFYKVDDKWFESTSIPWEFFHLLIECIWRKTEHDPGEYISIKDDDIISFRSISRNLEIEIDSIKCVLSMTDEGSYQIILV